MRGLPLSPSLVLLEEVAVGEGDGVVLVWRVSEDWGTGRTGPSSLDLECLFLSGGGPVGVRAGLWMGGGLADVVWGDGGRCLSPPGEEGRLRGLCLLGRGKRTDVKKKHAFNFNDVLVLCSFLDNQTAR